MKLIKYSLGELIEQRREKYKNSDEKLPIRGVSRQGFINPKQKEADTSLYNVFYKNDFVFNPARMEINSIALNTDLEKGICSSLYEIFYIKRLDILLPEYLNLFIKRDEFARMCEFSGWGSAREYFRFNSIADMDILLPDINIQQKYVNLYKSLIRNQKCYEESLEDLKYICTAYVERLKKDYPLKKLEPYVHRVDIRNGKKGTKNVMGVSTSKEFRKPTSKVNINELSNYKVCKPNQISFVQTTHNEKVFAYAFNDTDKDIVVTSVNEVFETDNSQLLPEYLCMFFNRSEFDRYARFHSWGSARETFTWNDLINVKIPIPDIEIQKSISNIFKVYKQRKKINDSLKEELKNITSILLKGSILEAGD